MAQANGNGIPLLRSHGAPWGLRFRSSDTSITVVMCVAVFTVQELLLHHYFSIANGCLGYFSLFSGS